MGGSEWRDEKQGAALLVWRGEVLVMFLSSPKALVFLFPRIWHCKAKSYQMPEQWVIPGCAHELLEEWIHVSCVFAHPCFVINNQEQGTANVSGLNVQLYWNFSCIGVAVWTLWWFCFSGCGRNAQSFDWRAVRAEVGFGVPGMNNEHLQKVPEGFRSEGRAVWTHPPGSPPVFSLFLGAGVRVRVRVRAAGTHTWAGSGSLSHFWCVFRCLHIKFSPTAAFTAHLWKIIPSVTAGRDELSSGSWAQVPLSVPPSSQPLTFLGQTKPFICLVP